LSYSESVVCYTDEIQNDYDKLGIYSYGCGLDKLNISYGHDEYLYQVLKYNQNLHKLPEKYLNIIRYHSLYPWHSKGEYRHFMVESDYDILNDVNMFNNFDLYSKEDSLFEITEEIKKYYDSLLKKYFSENKLKF